MFALSKTKKTNILTGIVLCPKGIAIARVQQQKQGQSVLEECDFLPVAVGSNIDLSHLLKGRGLDKQRCTIVLPVGNYQLLVVEAPQVPASELRAAIRWRIHDRIKFNIDEAVIDVFDVPSKSPGDVQKQLYVVVARSEIVKQHIDPLEQAGINLEIIDVPELALRNIAACLPEDEDGVAMLSFEQDMCLVTITRQSSLYLTRTLDIGYRQLQDVAADPKALYDRLALEIQRSMDYYQHNFNQAPIRSVAMLPLPPAVRNLDTSLRETLGLETRIVSVDKVIECPTKLDEDTAANCLLAVGAALRTESKAL